MHSAASISEAFREREKDYGGQEVGYVGSDARIKGDFVVFRLTAPEGDIYTNGINLMRKGMEAQGSVPHKIY